MTLKEVTSATFSTKMKSWTDRIIYKEWSDYLEFFTLDKNGLNPVAFVFCLKFHDSCLHVFGDEITSLRLEPKIRNNYA